MRFRLSKKLFPGARLNLSSSGPSLTIGKPGASVNIGKNGARATVGAPGTGLSHSFKLGGKPDEAVVPQMGGMPNGGAVSTWRGALNGLLMLLGLVWLAQGQVPGLAGGTIAASTLIAIYLYRRKPQPRSTGRSALVALAGAVLFLLGPGAPELGGVGLLLIIGSGIFLLRAMIRDMRAAKAMRAVAP